MGPEASVLRVKHMMVSEGENQNFLWKAKEHLLLTDRSVKARDGEKCPKNRAHVTCRRIRMALPSQLLQS